MKWLYPRLSLRLLPVFFVAGAVGAVVAGVYGVLHDQVTYTLAPEYYTKFKFVQFGVPETNAAPERLIVGRIGWAATWWVGLIVAWVLFRVAPLPGEESRGNIVAVGSRVFGELLADERRERCE